MNKDITGMKFGRLTAIEFAEKRNGHIYWLCKCECGNFVKVRKYSLVIGKTKSCGCLNRENRKLYARLRSAKISEKAEYIEGEEWKILEEHKEYSVSNLGRVKNNITNLLLKPTTNNNGYFKIGFWINNVKKHFYLHRLVAKYFVENKENKNIVNHKDGNRQNNNVNNLEWVTQSENNWHKYNILHYKNTEKQRNIAKLNIKKATAKICKKVKCIELDIIFESISNAEKEMKFGRNTLSYALLNNKNFYRGYHWELI